jgi:hypothetical protein
MALVKKHVKQDVEEQPKFSALGEAIEFYEKVKSLMTSIMQLKKFQSLMVDQFIW